MKKKMFSDIENDDSRVEVLQQNAKAVSKMNVPYIFSEEELAEMRKVHTDLITSIESAL